MPDGPTVANSSCIIALEAVGHLGILQQLYSSVLVPGAVAQECGPQLPAWIYVQTVQNQAMVNSLRIELGDGEAEAIAVAAEVQANRKSRLNLTQRRKVAKAGTEEFITQFRKPVCALAPLRDASLPSTLLRWM